MTLSEFSDFAEILGAFTIVFGIIFGLIQLRILRTQRRDLAILECAHSFEDHEFTDAYRLLSRLPKGITEKQLEAKGEEYVTAALRISMKFEKIGLLIHRGLVPMDAMDDLVGGAALMIWGILEQWIYDMRKARNHDNLYEWYQWLVDRMREPGNAKGEPAFLRYAKWKPH